MNTKSGAKVISDQGLFQARKALVPSTVDIEILLLTPWGIEAKIFDFGGLYCWKIALYENKSGEK